MNWILRPEYLLTLLIETMGVCAAIHALLYKRNPGAAFSWIIVNIFIPFFGPLFYYAFGINRIRRKATRLKTGFDFIYPDIDIQRQQASYIANLHEVDPPFQPLSRLAEAITCQPLLRGNHIQALKNGEAVYPAMLADIHQAQKCIYLSSYIFDTDTIGCEFIDALANAHTRGVDVKVLIDSYGETFQIPWASTLLKRKKIAVACFLPIFPVLRTNLRNHRKILLIDGKISYTGGINISRRHMVKDTQNDKRVIDIHFRLTGPIVQQIEHVFASDWHFTTGEHLSIATHHSVATGEILCRTMIDGPDNDVDIYIETLISAFSAAKKRICVMTPYFIPPQIIIASLNAAALRGVKVDILLPSKTDNPYIGWAAQRILWELLKRKVNVYYQPPPFVHSKLILVDDYYVQIGSVNLDTRSLRLNFELAVEVYNQEMGMLIRDYFDEGMQGSKAIHLADMESRSLLIKIRDAAAWLLSPYL